MLKQEAKLFKRINMALDLLIVGVSFCLSYVVVDHLIVPLHRFSDYLWVMILALAIWHYMLKFQGFYASLRNVSRLKIVQKLCFAQGGAAICLATVLYLVSNTGISRSLFVVFILSSFLLLLVEQLSVRSSLVAIRRRGYNYRNLLVVGTQDKARQFCQLVADHQDWGLRVLGFLQAAENAPLQESVGGSPVLGYSHDLVAFCKKLPVDEVVFCLPKDLVLDVEGPLQDLEEMGVTTRVVLDFYDLRHAKRELSFFHDTLPMLTLHTKSLDVEQLTLKRLVDIVGALVGLAITAVLLPFIALAIKLDSPGPLFFGQERVGESGRRFTCWKFRSMVSDAEARKQELSSQNEMNGAIFKMANDPRVTRVGRVLRQTSLDELPQFWNVLMGDMSLVGTRPPTPDEVENYQNWHRRRISIKPGMTGLWQVSGRNRVQDFDEVVNLDLKYIDNWSLWLDMKIICKTIQVVMFRHGSC